MRLAVGILYALLLRAGAVLIERPQRHASPPALFDGHTSAVVFTDGKVGSTTIARTLAGKVLIQGKFRYRYLTGTPQKWPLIVKAHLPSVAADFIKARGSHLHAGPVWVFAAVRQPFTRLVSNYFEAIETRPPERTLAMSMPEMREDFLAWVNESQGAGCSPFFHKDLRQVIGVNLADYAFPFKEGKLMVKLKVNSTSLRRVLVNSTSLVVVLLRFEDIARWDEIMRPIVPWWGRHDRFHLQDSRLVWYSDKYKEFSHYLRWPREKANELMKCDHFHFYSPAEQAAFYQHAVGDGPPPPLLGDGASQLEVDGMHEALFTFGGGAISDD